MIKRYLTLAGLGVLALLILAAAAAWVFRFGPFATGPSVAAKQLPVVQKKVEVVQAQETKAVAKLEEKTEAKAVTIKKRTATHVAKIQAAPSPSLADDAFYDGVCASVLYAGDPACNGSSR